MEGSLVAYKVFSNGSVLNASEINDNLMNQAVMVFSSAAARSAALTAPVEGMLTYLEDTNRYFTYDGTSWVSPFGQTLITTNNFTAQTSVGFDNVFSSEFRNYKIVMNAVTSTLVQVRSQLRLAGSPITSATYNSQQLDAGATTVTGGRTTGGTSWVVSTIATTRAGLVEMIVGTPFQAQNTTIQANGFYTSPSLQFNYGENTNATSYDGIQFFPASGNMTGSISIYGMKV
jgi:hypothetical protein